ncbi:MAG TPA: hypothetical protein VFH63_01940 [candidate division Zixibacteria bacterium]|nr:hypothetical protein [candidate division Zixibacteria bacterium]
MRSKEALSRYGEPRQTADIDIVLGLPASGFEPIQKAFQDDYVVHVPAQSQDRVLASVVAQSGLGKADFILDRDDAWARSAMARRQRWEHPRYGSVWVLTLEDLILAKLEWSAGVSELQLRDCANLVRLNASAINWNYLETYAAALGVGHLLARLRPPAA